MSELKGGRIRVRFGDVVRLVSERCDPVTAGIERFVGLEHIVPGDLRIRSWGDVADGTTFTNRFRAGQVLFGKRRAYQGKVAVADFEGVCSGDIYVFESADTAVLLPELIPFLCQTDAFFEHAVGTSAGSLSPRTNWTSLASYEFALPPIEEQRRASELLATSALAWDELNASRAAIGRLRTSMIDTLMARCGGRSVIVGDVCRMQNGRPFPSSEYRDSGARLLRPGNLGADGYLRWPQASTVYLDDGWAKTAESFLVRAGDVVMNLTAQSLEDGFMGRVCLAREGDECLLNQRIGRFYPTSGDLLISFLYRVFQTSRFQAHAVSMCQGTKVKHLFWHHLERYVFDLPDNTTQAQIVQNLQGIDEAVCATDRRAEAQKSLHKHLVNTVLNASAGPPDQECVLP